MLRNRNSSAIVAVSDIDRARTFYRDTLGLELTGDSTDDMPVLAFRTGDTTLSVYQSDYAGTNKANAVTWDMAGDLVETVEALKARGVSFERYDMDGLTCQDGWHEAGPMKLAWFKDPDGNILHLLEGM